MTEGSPSLLQYAEQKSAVIEVINDRVAVWILGYVLYVRSASQTDLERSLDVGQHESVPISIQRLLNAGFVRQKGEMFEASPEGVRLGEALGVPSRFTVGAGKTDISCDVFTIENVRIVDASSTTKAAIIQGVVEAPHRYIHGREGAKYGLVECGSFTGDVLFGYLTQEYLGRTLRYDENLRRNEDWETRNHNCLFVLPLRSQFLVFQDSKFAGAPMLNMPDTRDRMRMLLQMMFDRHGVERTGDLVLKPYERDLSREEMLATLGGSAGAVTGAQLELGPTVSLPEILPVFNPEAEWNRILTMIFKEYEVPNIAAATFKSTRIGTLSKSMLVKAMALAGTISRVTVGRGRSSRTIKGKVLTHIGRVPVGDPVTADDVANLLSFLQEKLGLSLADIPSGLTKTDRRDMQLDLGV